MQQPDFIDLRMRAEFHDLCGEKDRADALRQRSLEIAREVDINCYAYQLMWRGHSDQALELLQINAETYPDSWNVYDSLGEAYAARNDFERAINCYVQALRLVDSEDAAERIRAVVSELNSRRTAAQRAS